MSTIKICARIAAVAAIAIGSFTMFSSPSAQASEAVEAVPMQSGGVIKCCSHVTGSMTVPPDTCVHRFGDDPCDPGKWLASCPSEDSAPPRCTYL